jgi:hypothetical protein
MSKILERRKSRICFLNYLLLLKKQVVLLQIGATYFSTCVCFGAFSSSSFKKLGSLFFFSTSSLDMVTY